MSQIAMLLSNAYRPDPRVQREAQTLIEARHQVDLYCWDREGEFPAEEIQDGLHIHRLQTVRSRYAAGWRQIYRLPRFWRWARKQILRHPAHILHCHDLDTLVAGVALKRQTGCKLVFDAHEHYPALMSLYLPGSLVSLLRIWERLLIKKVDHILTASTTLAEEYRRTTPIPVTVVGNAPPRLDFASLTEASTAHIRRQIGLTPERLGIFYIGGFTNNRAFSPLFEALDGLPGWQLHIWGDGPQRTVVEAESARLENAHYHGWAASSELPGLFAASDAVYYCLRNDYPGAQYNAPNTLAYAMAAGRPLIANNVGDLGRVVVETGCGILLEAVTPASIRQALHTLENPQVRHDMGRRGRQAAESHYNWEAYSQNLLTAYARL